MTADGRLQEDENRTVARPSPSKYGGSVIIGSRKRTRFYGPRQWVRIYIYNNNIKRTRALHNLVIYDILRQRKQNYIIIIISHDHRVMLHIYLFVCITQYTHTHIYT